MAQKISLFNGSDYGATVARYHRTTAGSRILVSATTDLGVAAGDYDMRSVDNRNRYIYLLQVPEEKALNIYGMVVYHDKVKEKANAGARSLMEEHDQSGFSEFEVAILLDARPYIFGIYDAIMHTWIDSNAIP